MTTAMEDIGDTTLHDYDGTKDTMVISNPD